MKIDIFYLADCPYCINGEKALEELLKENPEYKKVEVNWIEESGISEFPAWADYYRVPSIFFNEKKLYEASPGQDFDTIKDNFRRALDAVIAG